MKNLVIAHWKIALAGMGTTRYQSLLVAGGCCPVEAAFFCPVVDEMGTAYH